MNYTSEEEIIKHLRQDVDILKQNLDALYQLICGTLISLVQPGFALFEAGAIHSKNAANIVLKNLLDTSVSALSYYLVGYAFAYGRGNGFVGLTYWAGVELPYFSLPHWYYQFVFANTAATIISGAVAERCNFIAYLSYSIIVTGVVYPIASSWVWNEYGWLKAIGFEDFSGSGVVHALGGSCSLVGAILIGPRLGAFINGKKQDKRGHNAPLLGVGMLLILTGFLAFNGGSNVTASNMKDNEKIALTMVNTILSASGAVFTCLLIGRLGAFGPDPWPYFELINSTLCGLVSACAGCDSYELWAAIVCGSVSVLVFWCLKYFVINLRIDDPVDAIATHLGSGFWGLLARPILKKNEGIVYKFTHASSWKNLGINMLGGCVLVLWGISCSLLIFGSLKLLGYLRCTEEEEIRGLDASKHGGYSYPLTAYEWGALLDTMKEKRLSITVTKMSENHPAARKLNDDPFTVNLKSENERI